MSIRAHQYARHPVGYRSKQRHGDHAGKPSPVGDRQPATWLVVGCHLIGKNQRELVTWY